MIVFRDTEDLQRALGAASEAHHVYEQETLGHADMNWVRWYAAHMANAKAVEREEFLRSLGTGPRLADS